MKRILPSKIKARYRNQVAARNAATNGCHFNAFENVINYMEDKIKGEPFPYIISYNHGNINASTALYYIKKLRSIVK